MADIAKIVPLPDIRLVEIVEECIRRCHNAVMEGRTDDVLHWEEKITGYAPLLLAEVRRLRRHSDALRRLIGLDGEVTVTATDTGDQESAAVMQTLLHHITQDPQTLEDAVTYLLADEVTQAQMLADTKLGAVAAVTAANR